MARFDTFVFDLDGTLLDTLPDLVVLTNAALNEQGFPSRTADEIHSFVGNGARALMYQAVPADASPEQAEAAMRRWMELYPVIGNKLTKPYPHMEETLAALAQRGIGLGVLSNKFDQGVHDVIDAYLPGLFPVQYGECDEIPRKPDPPGLVRRAVLYPIEQRATYAHHEREARFRDVAVRAHASDVLAKHGREPALIRLVIIQRTMFVLGLHVH